MNVWYGPSLSYHYASLHRIYMTNRRRDSLLGLNSDPANDSNASNHSPTDSLTALMSLTTHDDLTVLHIPPDS
jgi:hypothetical protein